MLNCLFATDDEIPFTSLQDLPENPTFKRKVRSNRHQRKKSASDGVALMRAGIAGNTSSVAVSSESSRMLSFDPESKREPERLVTLSALTQISAKVRCLCMSA